MSGEGSGVEEKMGFPSKQGGMRLGVGWGHGEKEEDEEEGKLAKVTASSLRKLNVSVSQKSTEQMRPCGLFEGKQGHVYRISLI